MRILVVGAGAIGGYFGGRMLAGRPRRHLSGAPAARRLNSPNAGLVIKSPQRRRDAEKSADRAGRQAQREIRRGAAELQGVRSRRRHQIVRAGGGTADGDHSAAQRHAASGCARREIRRASACSAVSARSRRRSTTSARWFSSRRCSRSRFGERDGKMSDRVRAIAEVMAPRQFRLGRQRKHRAGDVGEMGVPGLARGLDQPDAHLGRQYPGRARRQGFPARHGSTNAARSRPPRAMPPRAPFLERTHGMLTTEGSQMTASMFRDIKVGAAGRSRSRHRRPDRARRRRQSAGAETAHRLHASQGV